MSEKYIDLAKKIAEDTKVEPIFPAGRYQWEALEWLDRNPDQVPGRTITASERDSRTALLSPTEKFGWIKGFEDAGGRVVPDPEPTIPLPTETGAQFIAYSPKWSDGPEDQREFVVAGPYYVALDSGSRYVHAGFGEDWVVTDIVKAPGGGDEQR